jgi:ABC-type oligopeptide transport system substrate-binding subunit
MVPPFSIYAADIEPVEALRDTSLAELDLRIEAVAVNWNDFLDGLVQRRFPAYSLYWGADYPDPAAFLDILFRSDAPDNATGYRNADLDAILARARGESDTEHRADLYDAAQTELLNDGGVIPLYHDVAVSLVRPGVTGVDITPMGLLYLEEAGES